MSRGKRREARGLTRLQTPALGPVTAEDREVEAMDRARYRLGITILDVLSDAWKWNPEAGTYERA